MITAQEVQAADERIQEALKALNEARRARGELCRAAALERVESLHGRRVRDPGGRLFELCLDKATVHVNRVGELSPWVEYGQIRVRKDGGLSRRGPTHCYALNHGGNTLMDGWSWADESDGGGA